MSSIGRSQAPVAQDIYTQPTLTVQAATTVAPGMKVYADPETGELLEQLPEGVVEPLVTPKVTLPEPVQVESPVPGGGIGVDVRGRFQNPLQIRIFRIGSDGNR
jgi:hypothetical protein